jgi:hypothetical protein
MWKRLWVIVFAFGVSFIAAGVYGTRRGLFAKKEIREELAAEKIVTAPDARIPAQPVMCARTAKAQADVIRLHALQATGGKTFAELDGRDPKREVAFQGAALRTGLLSAVMAFNVADLVIGLSLFSIAVGFVLTLTAPALRPRAATH